MGRNKPFLLVLGTRGIPAAHGGFETFAQRLALFLVQRGWDVAVYCQDEVPVVTQKVRSEMWNGVELIHIQVASTGPRATLEFDWNCVRDAATRDGVCLVLGYNGAIFLPYLRLRGKKVLTNMDGMEWKRAKWSLPIKAWFWVNEWIAAWISNRLIADHPAIANHLATRGRGRNISTITYGGDPVEAASEAPVRALGLEPGRYLISIARIEPDNNILKIIEAFSSRRRNARLVVLGTLKDGIPYHDQLRKAASDEVVFPGAIYELDTLAALRFHARAYIHGHTVGGTNPSLVEALAAGNMVIAHDNPFNRWTADNAAVYFSDVKSCDEMMSVALANDMLAKRCSIAARQRAAAAFNWQDVLMAYEQTILALGDRTMVSSVSAEDHRGAAQL